MGKVQEHTTFNSLQCYRALVHPQSLTKGHGTLVCYQFLPAGYALHAHPAGPKITFMFSVCVCVCSSANITCAKLCHYVTRYASIATSAASGKLLKVCRLNRPTKVRQARLVLCCLNGERMVGNDDSSVLATGRALRNCCVSTFATR